MGMDATGRLGSTIGPYAVQEHLGSGPLGAAYRAYDVHRSRSVVVKVLPTLTAEEARRLAGGVGRVAAIRHPNALEVEDHGEDQGTPYLVADYVPGGSLAEALQGQTLSQEAALAALAGTANFVDYLHAEGLVHGDLKPANVLLGAGGHAFVTDFGVAALLPTSPLGSETERVTGTAPAAALPYTAPEQLGCGEPTPASDRYAFAAIAFELLTGGPPLVGQTADGIAHSQIDAPGASSSRPLPGAAVKAVLQRGLATDPAKRWQSCGQMVTALEHALVNDEARLAAAGATPGRRSRLVIAAVVAAVVGAVVLAIAAVLITRNSEPPAVGITLSDGAVPAGGTVVILGVHLRPHQAGTVELHGQATMGAFEADQYGNMATRITLPDGVRSGGNVIELCWQGSCHASARLTVIPAPSSLVGSPTLTPPAAPTPSLPSPALTGGP